MIDIARLARARDLGPSGEAARVRTRARITLAEMAAAVGVSKVTIHNWESGVRWPASDERALAWLDATEALQTVLDGATDVGEQGAYPKDAGEFAARWNERTPEQRDELVHRLVSDSQRSMHCWAADHDREVERLRAVVVERAFPATDAQVEAAVRSWFAAVIPGSADWVVRQLVDNHMERMRAALESARTHDEGTARA